MCTPDTTLTLSSERKPPSKKSLIFSFCFFFFFKFGHTLWHEGAYFPDQGSNPWPSHHRHGVLTTEPPEKSLFFLLEISSGSRHKVRLITFTWANAQWLHGDNFGNINSGAEDTGILHHSWVSNYVFASITRFSRKPYFTGMAGNAFFGGGLYHANFSYFTSE